MVFIGFAVRKCMWYWENIDYWERCFHYYTLDPPPPKKKKRWICLYRPLLECVGQNIIKTAEKMQISITWGIMFWQLISKYQIIQNAIKCISWNLILNAIGMNILVWITLGLMVMTHLVILYNKYSERKHVVTRWQTWEY